MKVFIFYSAHLEIEKDIQEREKLIEQIQAVDKRLNVRNGLLIGMLKGIIETGKGQNASVQTNLLITGGTEVKYQGITIHKRTTCNTWYARYRSNGKQHYVTARTQQMCYDKLKIALKQKSKTSQKSTTKPTFIEWYDKWLELFKKDVKEITKRDYSASLNYVKDIFNKPLDKITSIEIIELLNKITFERRRQKVYEILNDIFKRAKINEVIEKNPIEKIDKPKHKRINGQALTNQDEDNFETYLKIENLDMFLVCLYQGLRKGEMLALTINDFDFENKTLSINKSLNDKDEIDTTKNTHSVRVMPLFDKTLTLMQKYKNKTGRVFDYTYKQSAHLFEKFVKKYFAGKKYTAHSLRHTFVTKCQENNIPLHIIQKWVGHVKGSAVTSSVYTHTRESAELEFANIYNEKLNSN